MRDAPSTLPVDPWIAGRFVLEDVAGSGGMGTVYRAFDTLTQKRVALKLLRSTRSDPLDVERFTREARILSQLDHPAIVAYVAHGFAEAGHPFLAMEWLEGEDLSQRLRREGVSLRGALALLRRAATALDVAHGLGVVHRDLKPSNLFLRDGQPELVKLLDFGVAHHTDHASITLTRTGAVVGTLEYMAPEQVRGQRDVGPGADIFSLGCVFFECLTGRSPFTAEHATAALAKVLFEDPPRLRDLRPELPEALETLLTRMLHKDPELRLRDAATLLAALEPLSIAVELPAVASSLETAATGLVDDEQRLVNVIIATTDEPIDEQTTLSPQAEHGQPQPDALRELTAPYNARVELLADGSFVAMLSQDHGEATDRAVQAARCALLIKERWPATTVVLTTGRCLTHERAPIGEAISRAGRLLHAWREQAAAHAADVVLTDEVTTGLLGARFRVERSSAGMRLLESEVNDADTSRPLLGKPTPCIGREHELGVLELTVNACIDESAPRAVVMIGAPGIGKSRLCHEFLRRLATRFPEHQVLLARGDAMSRGAACGVLGRALRRRFAVDDGETLAARQATIRTAISRRVPGPEALQVAEFIGELCGVGFPDADSVKLRAARQDPRIMSDQLRQAFTTLLREECRATPTVLVLDDLQWGDAFTVKLVEAALRELHDQPLMVLAFARPEIADSFPNLWKGLAQQIIVNPLSKRACERLVQAALAGPTAAATVARMVEQSAGNALFLEELIRAVGDGHSAAVPETILAILQARIDAQAPEARRILRAASVFGETFWLGGVRAITASESQSQDTAGWLANLERSEIIDEAPQSRFSDAEYRFRQSLMRDAAYSLLTDEDRRTGHRLAGHYLERVGESDPVVLAEHAYRGDELARAVPHFVRAAAQALASGDLILTLQRVERGLSCGAAGEARGDLLALRSAAHMWRGEFRLALDHGIDALPLLVEGSRRWCDAMLTLFYVSTYLGESELFIRFFHDFGRVEALPDAIAAYAEAGAWLAFVASFRGQRSLAQFFLTRIQAASARLDAEDPSVTGWIGYAQAIFCHWIDDDLWLKQDVARAAIAAATQAGDRRMLAFVTLALALAEMGLGDHAHGEETLERLRLMLSALSEAALVGTSMGYAALALSEVGTPEALARAHALALDCIERLPPDAPVAGSAYIGLARHFEQRGELDIAEAHARRALNLMRVIPVVSLAAHETLVRVLLARHEIAAARDRAREGLALLASLECAPSTRTALRLAAAEALHAAGDVVDAHETLRDAADGLRTAANKIPEPAARTRYFTNVWRHARILELERAWLAPTPA